MLLKFYRVTLARMLVPQAELLSILSRYFRYKAKYLMVSVEGYSMRRFHLLMTDKTHHITFTLDEDLGCPSFFLDAVAELRIILSSYDSSLTPITDESDQLSAILETALWPYVRQCEELSATMPDLSRCIILANCYDLSQVVLRSPR